MNNYLNYYYGLYPLEVNKSPHFFYFNINNNLYYFIIYYRKINEAESLYQLSNNLLLQGIFVHQIILNKEGSPITYINNIPYILMKIYIKDFSLITLNDIAYLSYSTEGIKELSFLKKIDWPDLWGKKIDYFEYQISQVGKKHSFLCECLNYFIGLGENAILYIKNTILELGPIISDSYSIAHKRIAYDDTLFDLYNPLNFIIDYKTRDLAEYIKSCFWAKRDIWSEVDQYFKTQNISPYGLRLFYGRLLYPSFFFDLYESIIDGYLEDEEVLKIIERIEEYETFLKKFHQYLSTYHPIPSLSWLNNKPI